MSDIDTLPDVADSMQTAKELFAGAMGGIAQVVIGQPFDIVKVRLQTSTTHAGALSTAASIYRNEGGLAFYKGTATPLVGIGACVSVQFGAFHFARRFFESRNAAAAPAQSTLSKLAGSAAPAAQPLSLGQYYASGAFAGLTNSVLSCPIEHVRIRLQTQPHSATSRLYNGPLDCISKLNKHAGFANGLYRGYFVTVLREMQAYGVWFLTYEYLMQNDVQRRGLKSRSEVETWRLAVYGGLAGEMLWLASYPLDVVKSRMQTDGLIPSASAHASTQIPAHTASPGTPRSPLPTRGVPLPQSASSASASVAGSGNASAGPSMPVRQTGWDFGQPQSDEMAARALAREHAASNAAYTEHGVELHPNGEARAVGARNGQAGAAPLNTNLVNGSATGTPERPFPGEFRETSPEQLGKTAESVAAKGNLQGSMAKVAESPFSGTGSGEGVSGQSERFGVRRYGSMRDAFGQTFKSEGLMGFWRGLGPTLLRAMPVSAATFVVAEVTLRYIS